MRDYFVHPHGLVEAGAVIGARTKVWAFAHVCAGAVIGEDGNLCDHTFFESGVRVGHRVTVKCGVYLWDGVTVDDDVFIGPGVAFTNDRRPRSKHYPAQFLQTHLHTGCSLGANATLLPVTIGNWAMVAAGAVVTRDVPAYALVRGNPARQTDWVCCCGEKLHFGGQAQTTCACGRRFQHISATAIQPITP